MSKASQKWAAKNRERVNALQRAYCQRHPERVSETQRRTRLNNREVKAATAKLYRESHKAQIRLASRAHYERTREETLARSKAYKLANKAKVLEWNRQHYAKHKQRVALTRIQKEYGLTPEQYQGLLLSQSGQCAICAKTPKTFHVDHDHDTGAVRGLLCSSCNRALGWFKDDESIVSRAVAYLSHHRRKHA